MTMFFKQAEMRREVARRNVLRARASMAECEVKKREADLRRKLKSEGYSLKKIPARHSNRELFGIGYMVVNDRDIVGLGATSHEYDASLEDVAQFAGVDVPADMTKATEVMMTQQMNLYKGNHDA